MPGPTHPSVYPAIWAEQQPQQSSPSSQHAQARSISLRVNRRVVLLLALLQRIMELRHPSFRALSDDSSATWRTETSDQSFGRLEAVELVKTEHGADLPALER